MYFRQLLDKIDQYREKRDVFHDLMPFKVQEILLVATLYDSFIMEQEGDLGDVVYGEYHQLNLSSAPRITTTYTHKDALKKLSAGKFDMIIIMVGIDFQELKQLSLNIKELDLGIPTTLLFNNNTVYAAFCEKNDPFDYADQAFVWNGDPAIFLAMIKLVEDRANADNDSTLGMVRIVLLVEDSIRYYSRYLPVLYSEIMRQTSQLIEAEQSDSRKLLRMRARPKVLITRSYEEAVELFEKYREYLLCVISDVHFLKKGKGDGRAGVHFLKYVRKRNDSIPLLLQSGDIDNRDQALKFNAFFMDKKSESLSTDLRHFILTNLGFGKFVFKDSNGKKVIGEAGNMEEFEKLIRTVPIESILYHAENNHFSTWLMARGEVQFSTILRALNMSNFGEISMLRPFLIEIFDLIKQLKTRGMVINLEEDHSPGCSCIFRLAGGSLGGKGRGVAFINNLIERVNFGIENIDIKIPLTGIIGTDAFDEFMETNGLEEFVLSEKDYKKIRERFTSSRLPAGIEKKLMKFIRTVDGPIAVRSSGLFEDMLMQPFAGIYETYFLPNSAKDIKKRFDQLTTAVKLIYASIYSPKARSYFSALNYEIEEEKMAVMIQKVVGRKFGSYFYPHISGVAQSRNHYPVSYLLPEDGITVIAAGLGAYVVNGDTSFRFCPKYPKMDLVSNRYQINNSQHYLYAIDLKNEEPDIFSGENFCYAQLPVDEAKKHGSMKNLLSYYDHNDDRIYPGVSEKGTDIMNFANILKYNFLPFHEAVNAFLEVGHRSMGTPVEIELAFDIDEEKEKGTFYVLQLKPMIHLTDNVEINIDDIKDEELILFTDKGMGNGKIDDICDIVFVDPENFEKMSTVAIAKEISKINSSLKKENRRYILIGLGRWGSRDTSIGIPVNFAEISQSRIIVEAGFKDFQIDASLGSHFFHNITSMNIGYFTVNYQSEKSFIAWDWLKSQKPFKKLKYVTHLRFKRPLEVLMDGRSGLNIIRKPGS